MVNRGATFKKKWEEPPQGGRPGWVAPPDLRMGPWIRLLKKIVESQNLIPEFEVGIDIQAFCNNAITYFSEERK